MTDFFRKKSREKLYRQWIENEGLSPEDLPPDMKNDTQDSDTDGEIAAHQPLRQNLPADHSGVPSFDRLLASPSFRLVLGMAVTIVSLLVILAILLTMLVMRGC